MVALSRTFPPLQMRPATNENRVGSVSGGGVFPARGNHAIVSARMSIDTYLNFTEEALRCGLSLLVPVLMALCLPILTIVAVH